ncbi:hypothetical protein HFZ78_17135 [Priestia megaterium]|uniref:Uncharacterized protein n=1 Tax=Priestia megaterium TaxID=1404 RepID=A0A6H1P3Z3_PRIMG|nr:hypothetical protein [Priestia megaterium]QIZ08238.1 hypothetical protein HFZ78_17135 [Priestia megaterium]
MNLKRAILKFLLYFAVFTVSNLIFKAIFIPSDLNFQVIVRTLLTISSISVGMALVEYLMNKNKKNNK